MSRIVAFEVEGVPVPQGSKTPVPIGWKPGQRHRPRIVLVEVSNMRGNRLGEWRNTVTETALRALGRREPFSDAIRLSCQFLFRRPMSHYKRSGGLTGRAPKHATSRRLGDLSKLVRAIEDAITDAMVWADDAHVVEYGACGKRYCEHEDDVPGARILIEEI